MEKFEGPSFDSTSHLSNEAFLKLSCVLNPSFPPPSSVPLTLLRRPGGKGRSGAELHGRMSMLGTSLAGVCVPCVATGTLQGW